jgi:hypothetical protein
MALLAFRSSFRPSNEQKSDIITALKAINVLRPENIGIVFTFCDHLDMKLLGDNGDVVYKSWFRTIAQCVKKEEFSFDHDFTRVFCFSGYDGRSGPATT